MTMMMKLKKLQAAALAIGFLMLSAPAIASMHEMEGMSAPGMYNLTVGGLAGGDDARGIDETFRRLSGVEKVHVDFGRGMVMVWLQPGGSFDEELARRIVEGAGFTLDDFERPN